MAQDQNATTRLSKLSTESFSLSSSAQADDPVITDDAVFIGCSGFAEHDKKRGACAALRRLPIIGANLMPRMHRHA
jgi:hypothetical protein